MLLLALKLELQNKEAAYTQISRDMTDLLNRITVNPKQCGGRPCIRGMRIRVADVLDLFVAGLSAEEILEDLPDLEVDDIRAALSTRQES